MSIRFINRYSVEKTYSSKAGSGFFFPFNGV